MDRQFKNSFYELGFEETRDTYNLKIPNYVLKIIGVYKQVDFVKDKVLIEVQFGKYAFMFSIGTIERNRE